MEQSNQDNSQFQPKPPTPQNITEFTSQEFQNPTSSEMHFQFQSRVDLRSVRQGVTQIQQELSKIIVGQKEFIDLLIVGIFTNGHLLIEGVPGVAKTVTAKLVAKTMNVGFSRIQFTPDLMPSDILGTSVFNNVSNQFEFRKGPVFSNLVLIDEINRSPAKTQAALFEVMAERQITIDGSTYNMEEPFLVLATQNPIEQEGTYRLPEAQLDRFLFKIKVGYPSLEEEVKIVSNNHNRKDAKPEEQIQSIFSGTQITEIQKTVKEIYVEPRLVQYIASIVHQTRNNAFLFLGASPRASIGILNAAKAKAAISGRDFVIPEDVKYVAIPALIHRISVAPEKEMEGITAEQIIDQIIESIEVPR